MDKNSFLETVFYVLSNFLPYMILILYPFRSRFRFSKRTTYIASVVIVVFQILKEYIFARLDVNPSISSISTSIAGIIIFIVLIKDHFGKIATILILVMNLSIIPIYLGKFTEGIFFYESSLLNHQLTNSVMVLLWEIPLILLCLRYIDRTIVPAITSDNEGDIWNYLWTVPATFFIIWNAYLAQFPYYAGGSVKERLSSLAIILIISLGSFVIYHVTFLLINERIRNTTYAEQYKLLNLKVTEARRARHDIRHHLVMIDSYVKDGRIDDLKEYLRQYHESLPMEEALSFCDHYAVNALLTYAKQQTNMLGIDCNIRVNLPAELPLSDQEITIILGNLLENALDACRRDNEEQPKFKKRLEVKGNYDGNLFLLTIKNTSLHLAEKNRSNHYISSKRSGGASGLGIQSVENIVKKHKGTMNIQQNNGMFSVSIMIMNQS